MNQKKILGMLMGSKKFAVATRGRGFQLVKIVAGRPVSIFLDPTTAGNDSYWINPPSYIFHSPRSHYEYAEDERRMTRNKQVIMRLVQELQKTEVWEYIANKQFFTPNAHNKYLSENKNLKIKVQKDFEDMMKGK